MIDLPPQIQPFGPSDLVEAILLIDEASNKGAFHGWEVIQKAMNVRSRLLVYAKHWEDSLEKNPEQARAEETKSVSPKMVKEKK